MADRFQFRRGTAAEWTAANPVLADGELGLERDTQFYKIGDGVTARLATVCVAAVDGRSDSD